MIFVPQDPIDNNNGQNKVWKALKEAFVSEEGVAFYRFPIYQNRFQHREIDILLILQNYGVYVFECKGCIIDNIQQIEGGNWTMSGWYREEEQPVNQSHDQLFAVKNYLEEVSGLKGRLGFFNLVAIPFISKAEWSAKNFDRLPSTKPVLLSEDLTSENLQQLVNDSKSTFSPSQLSPQEWTSLCDKIGVRPTIQHPPQHPTNSPKFVTYDGTPLSETQIRSHFSIPKLEAPDSVYTYMVATAGLEARRIREGFAQNHQILKFSSSGKEEPCLLFYKALRHFIQEPLLTRTEERVLLHRAAQKIAQQDEIKEQQLRRDVFAWRKALIQLYERGIDLENQKSILNMVGHPVHQELMADLQRNLSQMIAHHGTGEIFEKAARSFLKESYIPTPIVILEGFTFLTPLQRYYIEICLERGAEVWILHPYRKEQLLGFEIMKTTYEKFSGFRNPIHISTWQEKSHALSYLKSYLFFNDAHPLFKGTDGDDSVSFEEFIHPYQEVKECLNRIQNYLNQGISPRDIAVVVRDSDTYRSLLREEAEIRGMQEHFDLPSQQLLLTPVGRFVILLYDIWKNGELQMNSEQLEMILASGWLGRKAQDTSVLLSVITDQVLTQCRGVPEWIDQFKNLRNHQTELAKHSRIPSSLVREKDIEVWEFTLKNIEKLCQRLFDDQQRSIGDHVKHLMDALTQLDQEGILKDEKEILQQILEAFLELSKFSSITLSPNEFGEVLNSLVQVRDTAVEELELHKHKISVIPPISIDQASRSIIFFLGLNDLSMPMPFAEDWPFYRIQIERHHQQERYLFLATIRATENHLHLSYSKAYGEHSYRPSLYFEEISKLLNRKLDKWNPHLEAKSKTKAPEELSKSLASRTEYTLHELSHYELCPYRYLMERLDPLAQVYKTRWQLRFVAQGLWTEFVLKQWCQTQLEFSP
ncbi:MAG: NERD domain-containing protein, partial [SAR324 cluster bacterium]|nr:NERD domain-containing protein [SAR324 cluster bacterium]